MPEYRGNIPKIFCLDIPLIIFLIHIAQDIFGYPISLFFYGGNIPKKLKYSISHEVNDLNIESTTITS